LIGVLLVSIDYHTRT